MCSPSGNKKLLFFDIDTAIFLSLADRFLKTHQPLQNCFSFAKYYFNVFYLYPLFNFDPFWGFSRWCSSIKIYDMMTQHTRTLFNEEQSCFSAWIPLHKALSSNFTVTFMGKVGNEKMKCWLKKNVYGAFKGIERLLST